MKRTLDHPVRLMALFAALAAVPLVRAEDEAGASVASPGKRQESVDQAKKLMAHRDVIPITADPFHPEAFNEVVAAMGGHVPGAVAPVAPGEPAAAHPAAPRTERDVLQSIAAVLKPSGYIVLGGQPSLSFGQKRVKAGGTLTINFEGTEYTLEITSIDRTNFTLRLNREEFTRPIK